MHQGQASTGLSQQPGPSSSMLLLSPSLQPILDARFAQLGTASCVAKVALTYSPRIVAIHLFLHAAWSKSTQ